MSVEEITSNEFELYKTQHHRSEVDLLNDLVTRSYMGVIAGGVAIEATCYQAASHLLKGNTEIAAVMGLLSLGAICPTSNYVRKIGKSLSRLKEIDF